MTIRMIAGLIAACLTMATAEEIVVSDLASAIPDSVKALGDPAMVDFPGGIEMAVTASTKKAQQHVNQGLNHLHGGWEFEASRHFAAAMREDPECLLAHWGMVMCLLNPSPETGEARNAATDRLMQLIEDGKGSALERAYAYGIIKYIEEGPAGAAEAFRKVAEKFPNDLQAGVFAALFSRGGYDVLGSATPDQEAAENLLLELIEQHSQSPVPLNALLFIRAEAPDLNESLPLARKLCQLAPQYAPYFHLLGHYEWRCGNHGEAASAFGRASSFYQQWMKANSATVADCAEWIKAECYRIVSIVSRGDFETAYAASRQIASQPLPHDRPASAGARYLMWDAKTLPARILILRGLKGNAVEASNSLPKPTDVQEFRKHSLAYWWIDGLRIALETQRLIDTEDFPAATEAIAALTHHGELMAGTQKAASESGERSPWLRSFRALEVLASDLRGRLVLAGPKDRRGSAFNWFSSAADRQRPEPMLYPPMILAPMALRLGDYFLEMKEPTRAIEAFERALATFPNDMTSLIGLKEAYMAAGRTDEASATEQRIERLKAP